ncbi:MAG: hypothetical protein HZB29_08800 [Nitrospinae bacterium]|nr:hypothetical protein [Nitrospinota bacterium]
MKLNILGVSLLFGRFTASVFHRGETGAQWDCPDPVDDLDSFKNALTETVEKLKYTHSFISFVIENDHVNHVFVQAPTLSKRDLKLFLNRRVEQEKTFEGPAMFSYAKADSPKGGSVIILNIVEAAYLNGIIKICQEMGFNPLQMFPLITVMGRQAPKLLKENEEMAGFVTQAGPKLALVIGRGDGSILFERFLNCDTAKEEDFDRPGRELNRSLLFAKQQFGAAAAKVYLLGGFPEEFVSSIGPRVDVPVEPAGIAFGDQKLIKAALKILPKDESNLIPIGVQTKHRRDLMVKVMAGMVAALWVVAIGWAALMEYMILSKRTAFLKARSMFSDISKEHDEWEGKARRYVVMKTSTDKFDKNRKPPAPAYLLGYLGNVLPDGLSLTKAEITADEGGWTVKLEGNEEKGHTDAAKSLKEFEAELANGPYHMTVVKGWREKWTEDLMKGVAGSSGKSKFVMSGKIR